MSKLNAVYISAALCIGVTLTGCSDPYNASLTSEIITPGQAQKLAEKLPAPDHDLFLRWAARKAKNVEFGGEGTAPTVRQAIANQIIFEARAAESLEEERKQAESERRATEEAQAKANAEVARIQTMLDHRQLVNAAIQKSFKVEALNYLFQPLTNSFGQDVGRRWLFTLRLSNFTDQEVVGAAGEVTFRDVFGKSLGVFSMRIEPTVPPGKSIVFEVSMPHDPRNPSHAALRQVEKLYPSWFMESVVFKNGQRIDAKTLGLQQAAPATAKSKTPAV